MHQHPPTLTSRVQNRTALDTAWLEHMVAAVTPAGLADFLIDFLPDDRHHGFAYVERRAARVWLADDDGPTAIPNPPGRKRSIRPTLRIRPQTLQEVAVFIASHELYHLHQSEHGRPIDPR